MVYGRDALTIKYKNLVTKAKQPAQSIAEELAAMQIFAHLLTPQESNFVADMNNCERERNGFEAFALQEQREKKENLLKSLTLIPRGARLDLDSADEAAPSAGETDGADESGGEEEMSGVELARASQRSRGRKKLRATARANRS